MSIRQIALKEGCISRQQPLSLSFPRDFIWITVPISRYNIKPPQRKLTPSLNYLRANTKLRVEKVLGTGYNEDSYSWWR